MLRSLENIRKKNHVADIDNLTQWVFFQKSFIMNVFVVVFFNFIAF